jgi:uncharacterized membrane protein
MERIRSVDFLRGIVIVIMTLDHCRDLLGVDFIAKNPTNLETTTVALFFTRWITHLCAPTFTFLSGVSAFLSFQRSTDIRTSRWFLIKRGLWLVLVNFTINNFGIFFDPHFGVLFFQIIAAIGCSLIGLGLCLNFNARTVGGLGLVIVLCHNLFDNISFPNKPVLAVLWSLFMGTGGFQLTQSHFFLVSYPIIPWLGIAMAGYGFGSLLLIENGRRQQMFLIVGISMIFMFAAIRLLNIYGDPVRWSAQSNDVFTFLSFINVTKYPPSLDFVLVTLGISISILAFADGKKSSAMDLLSTYGKTPLFYWLLHWYFLHLVAIAIYIAQGFEWQQLQFEGFGMGRPPQGGGVSLRWLYVIWVAIVVALFPICKWFVSVKERHRHLRWVHFF